MNNFVVARNALIASTLVMLFMLSLHPQYISRAIFGVSDVITTKFMTQGISAAEENAPKEDTLQIGLNSAQVSVPLVEGYEIEENENAAVLSQNGETMFVFTLEEYDGDIKEKAMKLSQSLEDEEQFTEVRVQPVLRGNNMFYEVSSKEQSIHYAVMSVNNHEIITIVPTNSVEEPTVNKILSGISFE
jgi:hypothetical protein